MARGNADLHWSKMLLIIATVPQKHGQVSRKYRLLPMEIRGRGIGDLKVVEAIECEFP